MVVGEVRGRRVGERVFCAPCLAGCVVDSEVIFSEACCYPLPVCDGCGSILQVVVPKEAWGEQADDLREWLAGGSPLSAAQVEGVCNAVEETWRATDLGALVLLARERLAFLRRGRENTVHALRNMVMHQQLLSDDRHVLKTARTTLAAPGGWPLSAEEREILAVLTLIEARGGRKAAK